MTKGYEVLKPGSIAINTAGGVSLGDLQKYAEEEFGPELDPDWIKVEIRDHSVILICNPPIIDDLSPRLEFNFDKHEG